MHFCTHAFLHMETLKRCESSELSFIWGEMRTAVQETAPHIALRNCSKEVEGGKVNTCDFGEEEVHVINHLPYKRFCARHKELMPP